MKKKINAMDYIRLEDKEKKIKKNLINDLYELVFRKGLCAFGLPVIEYFLTSPQICNNEINVCIPDDKDISEVIGKLADVLLLSYDVQFKIVTEKNHDPDSESDSENSHDSDCGCKSNQIITLAKMNITYKYIKDISFNINIYRGPLDEMECDFDFDTVYALDMRTVSINNNHFNFDYTLSDAFKAINEKKFRVIGRRFASDEFRSEDIIENTKELIKYLELSSKTANLLNNGWKIIGPRLDKVFYPCLIGKSPEDTKCTICSDNLKKYELKLDCCSQFLCFGCSIKYVNSRAHNSQIPCPLCKGDPFGFNTNE